MKKTMLLLGALLLSGASGYAQESRQDVSISATAAIAPEIIGNGIQRTSSTTLGFVASYRYLLTPRSGLEANYGYQQLTQYSVDTGKLAGGVHVVQSELSLAYVFNMNFKRFNPFIEAGPGIMLFTVLNDAGTTVFDAKSTNAIGGLVGAGVAYELSPSFDIRAEYRGFIVKTPDFGATLANSFNANRYELLSTPAIGIAYHF
jgi:outer membrane immunogenic protein